MTAPNHADPELEERWCAEQRRAVANYLTSQKLAHGRIGEWPAWHCAPYVSIWAIESLVHPEWIGWWAISGDLPTDYISADDVQPPQHPSKAMRVFAQRWLDVIQAWQEGREVQNTRIGDSGSREALAPLLESRAALLLRWADDITLWDE